MTDQGRGDPSANSHTNNTARNHQLESVKARHISAALDRGTKCSVMSSSTTLSRRHPYLMVIRLQNTSCHTATASLQRRFLSTEQFHEIPKSMYFCVLSTGRLFTIPDSNFAVLTEVLSLHELGLPDTMTVAVFREVITRKKLLTFGHCPKGGEGPTQIECLG